VSHRHPPNTLLTHHNYMKTTNLKNRLNTFAKQWGEDPFTFEKQGDRLEVRTELTSYDTVTQYFYELVEEMGYHMEYYGQCIYHIYNEA